MSIIHLDVVSGDNTWSIPIERRITILKGDSGSGKTELANAIQEENQLTKVTCELPCLVVNESVWESVMKASSNSLIIFDDMEVVSTRRFAELLSETVNNNNYFLLITREEFDTKSFGGISIAVSSILRLIYKEDFPTQHYTEPYYKFGNANISIQDIDIVLTEDSGSGYEFFGALFKNKTVIHSTSGKSTVVSDLDRIPYGTILVLVDMAAFGCHMEELTVMADLSRTFIIGSYECFEELLLQTNFFKNNEDVKNVLNNLPQHANKYISWESFFEEYLKHVTENEVIRVSGKSHIGFCWVSQCSECMRTDSNSCGYRMNNKLKELLIGTKYEFLLSDR